jgi:predicted nucleic acid-binding Zn ribbon protein
MGQTDVVPLYEYVCRRCAREFEELMLGGATPAAGPAPCGSCGGPRGPGACATD